MSEYNEKNGGDGAAANDPLRAPVAYSKGVGPRRAELLRRLGIFRAFDLLFYFPRDYLEISMKKSVDELVEDEVQTIVGTIEDYRTKFSRRGPVITLDVAVGDDVLQAIWFNQQFIARSFAFGRRVALTGKPKKASGLYWQMTHPKLTVLPDANDFDDFDGSESAPSAALDVENMTIAPIYPLTEGLTLFQMQRIIKNALTTLPDLLPEAFPEEYLAARNLAPIADAIRKIHFPATLDEARFARRRFVYQELLILQLALSICRTRRQVNMKAPILPRNGKIDARIRSLFPFDLTDAQRDVIAEISEDLGRPVPMNRLLQGDVGSGKTVVAIYAMLQAVANGAQAVLMAPTEVLARQHLRTLSNYLRDSSTKIVPLFGGQKAAERAAILDAIRDGSAQIVVGTQALVCNEIEFKRLGLVVVDEQHKFGVEQRAALKSASSAEPHYLVMTATPIPRSLTMTLFGDLDVSTMRGAPPGRRKTTTAILDSKNRASWWAFVREKLNEGRQAYVVVPRVDDSGAVEYPELIGREIQKIENDGTFSKDFDFWNSWEGPEKDRVLSKRRTKSAKNVKSANGENGEGNENVVEGADFNDSTDSDGAPKERGDELKNVWSVYRELSEGELRGFRLGVVHGRLTTADKEAIMLDFRSGKIQVLIATSVVEVGVDVPNATLMTIENAERFGLAQLHQLRGRIGRGKHPGFCAVAPSEYLFETAESGESEKTKETEKSAQTASGKSTKKAISAPKSAKATKKKKTSKKDGAKSVESTAEERRRAAVRERLEFFSRTTDGFELAEKDFDWRGPGELFGARQHGSAALRVADLSRDRETLLETNADAREITKRDPGLAEPKHAALRKQVLARYGRVLDLGDVG